MKILVEEEYGYRYWSWTPVEETMEAVDVLIEDVRSVAEVWSRIYYKDISKFGGEWEQIIIPEGLSEAEEDEYLSTMLNYDIYSAMLTIREDPEDSRILWNTELI